MKNIDIAVCEDIKDDKNFYPKATIAKNISRSNACNISLVLMASKKTKRDAYYAVWIKYSYQQYFIKTFSLNKAHEANIYYLIKIGKLKVRNYPINT